MTQADKLTISKVAIRQAKQCGLTGDPEARIRGIAAAATPTSHAAGNAVYGPFVLLIQGTHVASITLLGPRPVDQRTVSECKLCGGMMTRPIRTTLNGKEGTAYRPCPRAHDASKPLCDTYMGRTE